MDIEYGVRIDTGQTALTDYDLGVVAGVIQWKTGRSGLDGWKEGVLTKGSFSPVSQEIDLVRGGSYATMSGFSVSTRAQIGGVPVWKIIQDLGLNLVQAEAVVYSFRDGTPTQDWTGRVADAGGGLDEFKITCMDSFRALHKTVARRKVDTDAFPGAPSESIGDPVPATFGYVTHAKLLNVSSQAEAIECTTLGSTNYKVVACSSYNSTTLEVTLKTGRMVFAANDARLAGKFLSVFKGAATAQSLKILSNTASTGTGADTGVTVVTLDDAFDLGSSTNDTNATTGLRWSSGHGPQIWWFEINNFDASLVASELSITTLEANAEGRTILEYYDTSRKRFVDVSELLGEYSLTDISSLGFPGIEILEKRLDVSGEVRVYFNIIPTQIDLVSLNSDATWDSLTGDHSTNRANLIDEDSATYVEIVGAVFDSGGAAPNSDLDLTYDLYIPESEIEAEYEAYYVLIDQSLEATEANGSTSAEVEITLSCKGVDIYGSDTSTIADKKVVDTGVFFSVASVEVNTLPTSYYGEEGNNADFYAHKGDLDVSALIDTFKARTAYPKIRARIDLSVSYGGTGQPDLDLTWRIAELGIVGQKTLNVVSDDLFVKARGETHQSTWGGRKTTGTLVGSPVDVLEHIMREYDGAADAIDTTSFDAVHSGAGRNTWLVGRQPTEETESFRLAQELALFGFFAIIPKNNGLRGLKAWMDGGSEVAGHGAAEINAGSMSGREPTSLADVFNELQVNYAWNPATGKADKFFRITRIDEDEFPALADPEWKTYAIGIPDAWYDMAKEIWDRCHLSWQRYGFIRPMPQDMQDCKWGPDIEGDWGGDFDETIAWPYLVYLSGWVPFRKDVIHYSLPNTEDSAELELVDYILVNDVEATAGENEYGWIVRKAVVPGTGEDGKDVIEISLMLEPDTGD